MSVSDWVLIGACGLALVATILRIISSKWTGKKKERAEMVADFFDYVVQVCFNVESSGAAGAVKKSKVLETVRKFRDRYDIPVSDEQIAAFIDNYVTSANAVAKATEENSEISPQTDGEEVKQEMTREEANNMLSRLYGADTAAKMINSVPVTYKLGAEVHADQIKTDGTKWFVSLSEDGTAHYFDAIAEYGAMK
ncbi:phage holin, LLH family [Barnesiella intestinihominis]|uniref:phage holin, LLH family n=1 Tax=Barnesiella intestinihominis TaxID=487174 RepID=UPI003AB676CD